MYLFVEISRAHQGTGWVGGEQVLSGPSFPGGRIGAVNSTAVDLAWESPRTVKNGDEILQSHLGKEHISAPHVWFAEMAWQERATQRRKLRKPLLMQKQQGGR